MRRALATLALVGGVIAIAPSAASAVDEPSFNPTFTRGDGNTLFLSGTNTGAGTASAIFFTLNQPGFTFLSATDNAGLNCAVSPSTANRVQCLSPLDAGKSVIITMQVNALYPDNGGGTLQVFDSSDNPQPPQTITGPAPTSPPPSTQDFEVVSVEGPFGWRSRGQVGFMNNGVQWLAGGEPLSFALSSATSQSDLQSTFSGNETFYYVVVVKNDGPDSGTCAEKELSQLPLTGPLRSYRVSSDGSVAATDQCGTLASGQTVTFYNEGSLSSDGSFPTTFEVFAQQPGDVVEQDDTKAGSSLVAQSIPSDFGEAFVRAVKNGFSGTTGSHKLATASTLKLDHVDIAVLKKTTAKPLKRAGASCLWLKSKMASFKAVKPDPNGVCSTPLWLRAKGTSKWSYKLSKPLSKGKYVAYARAVTTNGLWEFRFSPKTGNEKSFKVG